MALSFPKEAHPHADNNIVSVRETGDAAAAKRAPSSELLEHVKMAQTIIRDVFDRFPASEIGISFNGGKDSVVMFELIRRTVPIDVLKQCCVFVIDLHDEFDEILDFRARYMRELKELTLLHQEVIVDMREGLCKLLEKRPLKVVFMGTRKTDPHGRTQQSPVQMTTAGWPNFLRACPLFSWSVLSVWEYTRLNHVPQCKLYEDGYTSLGDVTTTSRNPHLRREDGTYKPAWELTSADFEREGRHCHC
ncbi:phosphoadenosine phosphosulfate reductase-like protein [Leptomonas pyrrhocoris]|uniref:FAD synthase n=1 Tax=Leptomonas pyrrhocoris TaxID=157538 RepID=A0A0N0VHN2_LEPPY|nr:phosphoadenosine phosphosulfate reductase-like protein [Leptomonas pyrrhocoris]XP_015663984.1 phosphoadenosine phosphosulfate reductase-like protein [Leptomonas pyrrhocoris]KPA85544.1 phosphoadenosine phosphosulfate reductase-like protein [Leptomonas pyrrhocoris]KPA85545.1 phosphoadenosine phosphosulfate reductase-like protein [Leptomonas pyrrhocoris]|eukprot:XP_015663983.1 phosphoadenosine phosphosulfate reductase-like protein [Leptomonas pyrrhocoris]